MRWRLAKSPHRLPTLPLPPKQLQQVHHSIPKPTDATDDRPPRAQSYVQPDNAAQPPVMPLANEAKEEKILSTIDYQNSRTTS